MPPFLIRCRVTSAIALAMAGAGCQASAAESPPQGPPPSAVGIAVAELKDVVLWNDLSGRIEASRGVELRPRVSGYITSVRYREGSQVAAGQVLFTIDERPYRAALRRAQADLSRARSRARLARVEADRGEALHAASAIPRAERDTLTSTAAQAAAEVQGAQAQVALARLDVEFTEVKAPLAGRTGRALVSVGDYVAAGPVPTSLTTLVSVDPVYVYFTCDEHTYLRFAARAEHSRVTVGLADETGFPHDGTVDFVDSRADATTGTVVLRAVVANPDNRLTPGLFARVRLPEGQAIQGIAIDDKAILTDQDRRFVYVLGADGTVERRDIKLGRELAGQQLVTEGLKPGDRVIVSGVQTVAPGSKAIVAAPAAPAAPADKDKDKDKTQSQAQDKTSGHAQDKTP